VFSSHSDPFREPPIGKVLVSPAPRSAKRQGISLPRPTVPGGASRARDRPLTECGEVSSPYRLAASLNRLANGGRGFQPRPSLQDRTGPRRKEGPPITS
jgi:hypothetical protein